MPLVYDELRRLAGGFFRDQPTDHTLWPTALVNEAYIRLEKQPDFRCNGRTHFFNIAAKAMRQILTDHMRRRKAIKRGGERDRVTLDDGLMPGSGAGTPDIDLLDLMEALDELSELNARHAEVVIARVFGGLTVPEIAEELKLSKSTIENDWFLARSWLHRRLKDRRDPDC